MSKNHLLNQEYELVKWGPVRSSTRVIFEKFLRSKLALFYILVLFDIMGQIICWIDLKTCQFFSAEVNLLTAGQLGRAELRQQVIFSKQLTCFEKLTCCLSSARRDCPAVKRLTSAEKNWHVFRSIKQMILPIGHDLELDIVYLCHVESTS